MSASPQKTRPNRKSFRRRVVRLEEFTEEEIALIMKAEGPSEHAALNHELKD
jgi:hypothetical protein